MIDNTQDVSTATFARPAAPPIEAVAEGFRRACREGDSVLTPGQAIWTPDSFAELLERFVNRPEVPGTTFDAKLENQLSGASLQVRQLFAEVFAFDLLPLIDYKGRTKRDCIALPLRLGGLDVPLPDQLDRVLDLGVFKGGVAFKTRRYIQLSYLIQVFAGLIELPDSERDLLLREPVAFRNAIDGLETVNAPSQRNALLYLFFPRYFLPVVKTEHRQAIRDAFLDRIGSSTGDLDADLNGIYHALVKENGGDIDLYQPPFRERWDPAPAPAPVVPWDQFTHWATRIAQTIDVASIERGYKIEMANRIAEAWPLVEADEPVWAERLKSALSYGNLLNAWFKVYLFKDLQAKPEAVRQAMTKLLQGEVDPTRLEAFQAEINAIRDASLKLSLGNAAALGSVLFMSRDAGIWPPYRARPVGKACKLLGLPIDASGPTGRYQQLLRMCDELLERIPQLLDDRLDAQGLLWTVVETDPPVEWTESERLAFLNWRGDIDPAPAARRAWRIRGGDERLTVWREQDFVSLDAARLRPVSPGIDRAALGRKIDTDYSDIDSAQRKIKLDELHPFLSIAKPDDLIVSVSGGRIYFGDVQGEPEWEDGSALGNIRRTVEWRPDEGTAITEGSVALISLLNAPADLIEATSFLEELDRLREHVQPRPVVPQLRPADDDLAARLHVGQAWIQNVIDMLDDRPQLIFYGPPGTGKTYLAREIARHLAPEHVTLVQFHPAYSYEDFFEGYRPTASGGFDLKHGPLRRVVANAQTHPGQFHVLIIDEINRGNLAKIFGELYFLLEYRDESIDLLYAEDGAQRFSLPRNVIILGTMNTADRSIALLDSAMRRRFAFVPLIPDEEPTNGVLRSWLKEKGLGSEAADLLDRLNEKIEDPDFKIGPSYLMRAAVHQPNGLDRVWRTSILPLLEEHHFGDLSRPEIEARYGLAALRAATGSSSPLPLIQVEDQDHDASA